jgi:hypothetical protein
MEFLIKTYNNNKTELITAALPEETQTKLLNYLQKEHIRMVDKLPESTGVFCIKEEDDIYYIHRSFYDKGYETYILYTLQWTSWTEKHAAELYEVPNDKPKLVRS